MQELLFKAKFPVPIHAIKKNNKQIAFNKAAGRRFIMSNNKARFYEEWLNQKLITEKLKQRLDTITHKVHVCMKFYFPKTKFYTKKGEQNKKLADLSNLYQAVEDALQSSGVIENDNLIESHDGSRRLPIDDTSHWLEITISAYQD
jgi:Holliday junction resolvase RusA-like endonuclease